MQLENEKKAAEKGLNEAPDNTVEPDLKEKKDSETVKTYSLVEVRAKLADLQKAGKRAEVKELLTGFGVAKLSELPEDQYGELMKKAGEL